MNLKWYKSLELFNKTKKIKRILFICSGNTCRSPAAVYYFKEFTSWWSGISAFSRGTEVVAILSALQARGININKLMVEPESKKVIGDKTSKFLSNHEATQISDEDIFKADLILTMEKSIRNKLRIDYPDFAYKIFTLKGFVTQTDNDLLTNLDVGNPFLPPAVRKIQNVTEGKVAYYRYLQNYANIFEEIKIYVRKVVEIIYSLNTQKKR